jgi:hypothetical protein
MELVNNINFLVGYYMNVDTIPETQKMDISYKSFEQPQIAKTLFKSPSSMELSQPVLQQQTTNMDEMFNNLYVTNSPIFGGTPQKTLSAMKTQQNKYVMFGDRQTVWEFDADNKNSLDGSNFVGNGTFTAVFSLKLIKNAKNYPLDVKTQYILRVVDDSIDEIKHFIDIWKNDKREFPLNIIDIFFYGSVIGNGTEIARYVMTRRYGDYHDIEKLDIYKKQKYLYNVLQFLNLIHKNNIIYHDFKFQNIGFDDSDELIFIVLDYDDETLLRKNSSLLLKCVAKSKQIPNVSNHSSLNHDMRFCSGTYLPYFMSIEKQDKLNPKFDKIYSSALASTLCHMFFNNPHQMNYYLYHQTEELNAFFAHEKQNGVVDKHVLMQKYDENIRAMLQNLRPNFSRAEFEIVNKYHSMNLYDAFCTFLRVTIENLIDLDYNKVMYPQRIINLLTKTLTTYRPDFVNENDMVNAFCGIST